DSQKRTILHMAVTGSSSLAAKWALESNSGLLEVEDNMGRTPLHNCDSPRTLQLLLKYGANINYTDKFGMTTLHHKCLQAQAELVQALLSSSPKPDLNLRNNSYGTPLHCAVIGGSIDVVLALLNAGASPNLRDKLGNTPAHIAARLNRPTIMRILIKHGAD
ncbi:ankyrin repeat-containing domain protein, partial [Podospora fimiseda]